MFRIVFLCVIVNFVLVLSSLEEDWRLFKENYQKKYSSKNEDEKYFSVFKENVKEIERHNKLYDEGKVLYKKGITKFADLTAEEFTEKYGLSKRPLKIYSSDEAMKEVQKNSNKSEYLDWRKKGAVTRVKDQGTCGSCWIFSAVGMLESFHYRKTKKLITFSEQHMVDCVSNSSCSGGWSLDVFYYLIENGRTINKEEDYPYKALDGKCRYQKSSAVLVDFNECVFVADNDNAIKEAVTEHGPVLVALYANDNWKLYKTGVWYEPECSPYTNHAVLLVGYGSENGHDYWLLKNSWGKDWGENGYIKFIRNKHKHYCGIQDSVFYLV